MADDGQEHKQEQEQEPRQPFAKRLGRHLGLSALCILGISAAAIVYGLASRGALTFAYVFNANFLAGSAIVAVGLVLLFWPGRVKFDKLTDHTTLVQRHYIDRRLVRQKKAYPCIFLGLTIIILAGTIQLALAAIIPGG